MTLVGEQGQEREDAEVGVGGGATTTSSKPGKRRALSVGDRVGKYVEAGEHREAIQLCCQEYALRVGKVCMAIVGDQSEAEDLTQDTFVTAYRGLGDWRQEASVLSWLLGIARKLSVRHVQKRARRDGKLHLVKGSTPPAADELLSRRRQALEARTLLERVRPTEREALLLRFSGELSFKEVAAASGIDEAAARKRVSRGINRLRECMKETETP